MEYRQRGLVGVKSAFGAFANTKVVSTDKDFNECTINKIQEK